MRSRAHREALLAGMTAAFVIVGGSGCERGQASDPAWTAPSSESQQRPAGCPDDLPTGCPAPPPSYARDVAPILRRRCLACHGDGGVAQPQRDYTSYAGVYASRSAILDQVYGCAMPPPDAGAPSEDERAALLAWLVCGAPDDDPFAAPAQCTSGTTWNGATNAMMRPGEPCLRCHGLFGAAGTVYPTGHEPDDCDGVAVEGAEIVIVGSDSRTIAIPIGPPTGNFFLWGSVAWPARAKVVYRGAERSMDQSVASGDCNSCHTQDGADAAPGRIVIP